MRGAWLAKGFLGLVLLAGIPSACLATELYDRKLEQAVLAIVADKLKVDIRGSLAHDWRMPAQISSSRSAIPVPGFGEGARAQVHGSFVEFGSAPAAGSLHSAGSPVGMESPRRPVRIIYF